MKAQSANRGQSRLVFQICPVRAYLGKAQLGAIANRGDTLD